MMLLRQWEFQTMKVLKEIKDIYIGWRNDISCSDEIKQMAERRMSICQECPNIKTELVVRCGLCGCPLSKMLKVPERRCKDNRWLEEDVK